MREFEARRIDKFIQILHRHREELGSISIKAILEDVTRETKANAVEVRFDYPFFVEKLTPVQKESMWIPFASYDEEERL